METVVVDTTVDGISNEEIQNSGLLIPLEVRGTYARSGTFEAIVNGFDHLVKKIAVEELGARELRFPPIFGRDSYQRTGHISNFPDLLGSVHGFTGTPQEHRAMLADFDAGAQWERHLVPVGCMLCPAICYPLYPTQSGSSLPEDGRRFDLQGFAFRHEPSDDPARMQIFRMHEVVRIGTAEQTLHDRDYWLKRGAQILQSLGLAVDIEVAHDPFFGDGARLQKAIQREQTLKYEFTAQIWNGKKRTAIGSVNYHLDHFGTAFNITAANGSPAFSTCTGFGLERVALALVAAHGVDVGAWPASIRDQLGLD